MVGCFLEPEYLSGSSRSQSTGRPRWIVFEEFVSHSSSPFWSHFSFGIDHNNLQKWASQLSQHCFTFTWLNQSSFKYSVFMYQDIVDLVKTYNKSKLSMKLYVLCLY